VAEEDRELEPAEAAKILGVSTSTVRRYETRGLLRPRRLLDSRHRRYSAASVAELQAVNAMPEGPMRDATLEALRRRNREIPAPEDLDDVSVREAAEELFATLSTDQLRQLVAVVQAELDSAG
jgi:DNA-binding transcriptional MerR regulator